MTDVNLFEGDCLVESDKITSGSVDLILTDPPYGTMNGFNGIDWDFPISPEDIFEVSYRLLRPNGKLVLFSQEPYTSTLITSTRPNFSFSYRMIWEKDGFANALLVNSAPVGFFEDVLVFHKRGDAEFSGALVDHPLKDMFNEYLQKSGRSRKFFNDLVGSSSSHYFTNGVQFRVPTVEKFEIVNKYLGIPFLHSELMELDKNYKEEVDSIHKDENPSVFNLWEGGKYKSNILRYKKDYDGYHPTQKPVLLLEDLIKTYSNEGDFVVDLTMGSGSTGVAAVNSGRKFTGIEQDTEYFEIAKWRIDEAIAKN